MSLSIAAILCLSSVLHYEARGEPLEGKLAVAEVVLNRVEHHRFPDTVCEVVTQPRQFSWYPRRPLTYGNQRELAEDILAGEYERKYPRALFFTSGSATLRRPHLRWIGGHRFYSL